MQTEKQKTGLSDEPRPMSLEQSITLQQSVNLVIRLWTAVAIAVGSLSLLLVVLPSNMVWLFGIFVSIFVLYSVRKALHLRHLLSLDLRNATLTSVEGNISLDVLTNNRGGESYRLQIEGLTFSLSKEMFLSLSNHQPYRVYYAPHTKFFFTADPLF